MSAYRTRFGLIALSLLLVLATGLAACGKKGPLYLPKEGTPPPASVPAVEAPEKDKTKP